MPRYGTTTLPRWTVAVTLAVVTAVVMMLAAPDSSLHDLNDRYDCNWFLTAGRAWALGLTPYVDFSDSKGPLLWLIYRFGYTLSHTDFAGVFWLASFGYLITGFFAYRTAALFVPARLALTVAVAMTLAWFNPVFFNEIRAEDFCHLPVMASLCFTARAFYDRRQPHPALAPLVVGAATAALLLIKYNIAAMNGIFALSLLWHYRRRLFATLAWGLLGMAIVILPMAALLWHDGCLRACIDEYFVLTAVTTANNATLADYAARIWRGIVGWSPLVKGVLLAGLAGSVMMAWVTARRRWWPLTVFLWFLAFTLLLSWQAHHFGALSFAYIFLAIAVLYPARYASEVRQRWLLALAIAAAVACAAIQNFYSPNYHGNWRWSTNDSRTEYNHLSGIVASRTHPRILFWRCYDTGIGTRAEALPACRYWAKQSGATPAMNDMQDSAVARSEPHFVVIHYRQDSELSPALRAAGYRRHTAPVDAPRFALYERE